MCRTPRACRHGPTSARRRPAAHALLGELRSAPGQVVEGVAPPGPLPPTWRTWVRPLPTATSADPWVERPARSLCSTWGVGPPGHGRTCTPTRRTSRRAWTSTPRSSTRAIVGVAPLRCAFAGGAGGPAVVDRQGVVTRAPPHRQRWRTGGLPAHVGPPVRWSAWTVHPPANDGLVWFACGFFDFLAAAVEGYSSYAVRPISVDRASFSCFTAFRHLSSATLFGDNH